MNLRKRKKFFNRTSNSNSNNSHHKFAVAIPRYQNLKTRPRKLLLSPNVSMLTAAVLRQSRLGDKAEENSAVMMNIKIMANNGLKMMDLETIQ